MHGVSRSIPDLSLSCATSIPCSSGRRTGYPDDDWIWFTRFRPQPRDELPIRVTDGEPGIHRVATADSELAIQ
jgi:hypothetical protein